LPFHLTGGGEEQGVEGRAVEPFPGIRAGGDDQQRRAAWPGCQARDRRIPAPGAHAAAEDDRVVTGLLEILSELAQIRDPLGEHHAVAASGQGGGDVGGDLAVAAVVVGQVAVDHSHPARCPRVGVTVVAVAGLVQEQDGDGPGRQARQV
jgi:hypothetical protein